MKALFIDQSTSKVIVQQPIVQSDTLVVFDERVQDLAVLYQALLPSTKGYTIYSQDNALEVITKLLANSGANSLVLVGHGEPGVLHIGKKPMNIEELNTHSYLLQEWRIKEISLYSCELAKGDVGENFIYRLSTLTGANVSASATKTGSAQLGGNWDLAITTGESSAPSVFQLSTLQTYQSVLPVLTLSSGIDIIEGGILGAFEISLDSPAPAGGIIVHFTTTGSTATPNVDYTLIAGVGITAITANTFTIAAGVSRATINVSALNDNVIDPNETITLNLSPGAGYNSDALFNITSFTVNNNSNSSIIKDFNNDGKLDLLTSNSVDGNVSILLGIGNGTFGGATNFVVGSGAGSIEAGDFNNDGKVDLARANSSSNDISILLGNGNGTFGAATNFAVGSSPGLLKVADLNGDGNGKIDLLVGDKVLFGNGNGTFGIASPTGITSSVSALIDLNGDGKLDIVGKRQDLFGGGFLLRQLGNGDGTFGTETNLLSTPPYSLPYPVSTVSVGDFNNDGKIDLATTLVQGSGVTTWLGDGNGAFPNTSGTSFNLLPFSRFVFPNAASVGDFNNDGKLDLAVAASGSRSFLTILIGNGDGTLSGGTPSEVAVSSLSTGDFNGDGKLDLVRINNNPPANINNISVMLNDAATIKIVDNTQFAPSLINFNKLKDFNGDGKADILWRNISDDRLALWQMNGSTTISTGLLAPYSAVDSTWKIYGSGDFDGDSKADILWRDVNGSVSLWRMNGANVLSTNFLTPYSSANNNWQIASTDDFNGDGRTDILWRNTDDGRLSLWQMNGSNALSTGLLSPYPTVDNSWKVSGTGDFNGDGKADILWRHTNGSVSLWQMNGANVISTGYLTPYPIVDNSWQVAGINDFNGDGNADILWHNDDGRNSLWQMNGSNAISTGLINPYPDSTWKISGTGDVTGDGKADILWRNQINGSLSLWQMNGANVISGNALALSPDASWQIPPAL
jgi:hypothetical protein